MAPTVHLVRHAQGFHNLCKENEQLPDPDLTPLGKEQCEELRRSFPFHDRITRIISSPLRRTLHTTVNVFGKDNLYPILALDSLQEVSDLSSDTGSEIDALQHEFGDKVDLSQVSQSWTDKTTSSPFQADITKLEARAAQARKTLYSLLDFDGDDHVVVVTHGDYLHFLTEDWHGVPEQGFYVWKNCEYRSYQFDPTGKDVAGARLVETETSWKRRHGDASRPTPVQQDEWRNSTYDKLRPEYAEMGKAE
ncbi:hypothetical protein Golomagni_08345 [Golovinomyces magnicellulatus]|nr:hypothetical protein Golomagni_08345 [Golovinomyces magnicellulatus]